VSAKRPIEQRRRLGELVPGFCPLVGGGSSLRQIAEWRACISATRGLKFRSLAVLTNSAAEFLLQSKRNSHYIAHVTIETFKKEITEAGKAYDKYIVCLDKTPEDFSAALGSLMQKAIKAYENRGSNMRHGIALDKQVTIILSQSDGPRPLCGIYFNLHSPYKKNALPQTVKPLKETIEGSPQKSED